MFLKVVIYRNVEFTHPNTQKDITELKENFHLPGNGPLKFEVTGDNLKALKSVGYCSGQTNVPSNFGRDTATFRMATAGEINNLYGAVMLHAPQ